MTSHAPRSPLTPVSDRSVVLQLLPALKDGGVEKSAIEMAIYIERQGWVPIVASAGGPKTALLEAAGIRHISLPLARKTPWGILWNVLRINDLVRREKVSLIHARSRGPAWSGWLASRLTGVPFVTTFHGTYGLGGGFLKRFYNSVMVRGPFVIANSTFIKAHIIENYGVDAARIVVAARGVEPEAWNPDDFTKTDIKKVRDELEVPKTSQLVLMVGRITRWKGHDLVIEALGQMTDLDWVLAIAGGIDKDSEYGKALKHRAEELGVAERIRWLGSRSDVARLLAASDLAVSGSTRPEAFGRVAIEAQAMGVPVVATGIGGSLETIVDGKTGFLVYPDAKSSSETIRFGEFTPQAMALKLREALHNPRRLATMGHAARTHVLSTFTVDKCCAAEFSAYTRVLGDSAA